MSPTRTLAAVAAVLLVACATEHTEPTALRTPGAPELGPPPTTNPACTSTWAAGVTGNWTDAAKWSPAGVPGAGASVCITVSGAYTVTLDPAVDATPVVIDALTVGGATGSQTLKLTGTDVYLNVTQGIAIGANGTLWWNAFGGARVTAGGTVTNAGNIAESAACGGCGQADALTADLINQGSIGVTGVLTLNKVDGSYVNNGTITLSGGTGIVIPASAGSPVWSQDGGVVNAPTHALLSMLAGTYTLNGGNPGLSAQTSQPVVRLTNTNLVLGATVSTADLAVTPVAGTPPTITGDIPAPVTLWLLGDAPFVPSASVNFAGNPTIYGTLHIENLGVGSMTLTGAGTITNRGVITTAIVGGQHIHFGTDVVNHGTWDVRGEIHLDKAGGTYRNFGTLMGISAALLRVEGSTLLNEATGVVSTTGIFPDGGIVKGIGSLPLLNPKNSSLVEIGLPIGVLNVTSYSPDNSSALNIELGGTGAGTGFDQMVSSGQATFGGTLNIIETGGFQAGQCGQAFDIIVHTSVGGSANFTTVTGLNPAPGRFLRLQYINTPQPRRVVLYGYNPTVAVGVNPNTLSAAEGGGSVQYAVCLGHQPTGNVTVNATADAQVTVSPASLVFTPANYFQPQYFTVTAVDDQVIEGTHTGTVTHNVTSTDGSFGGASVSSVITTITDNDAPPNQGPAPVDDVVSTPEDNAVVVSVLANDTDPDNDPLTVTAVTQPAAGTAQITSGGSTVTFTPAANFNGAASFQYTVSDGQGHTAQASVGVTVQPGNDNPSATDDAGSTTSPSAVVVAVLANDSDIDGDALAVSAVTQPANGIAAISGGGASVTYTPNAGYSGGDAFTYTVSDGQGGTAVGTVTITVNPAPGNQPPVAVFTAACPGRQCTFDASGSTDDAGIVTYTWAWGNGRSESHSSPVTRNTYATNGTYSVTLTVTDAGGLSRSLTSQVIVPTPSGGNQPPTAVAVITCAPGRSCTMDGRGSTDDHGIVRYEWRSSSNTLFSNLPVLTRSWNAAGAKTGYSLTVFDAAGLSHKVVFNFVVQP